MSMKASTISRRQLVQAVGAAAVSGGLVNAAVASEPALTSPSASNLRDLAHDLRRNRGRRDFKTVPMILTDPSDWDDKAIKLLLAYNGKPKQVWDSPNLFEPWLNMIRNTVNTEVFSWKHPDFLAAAATHATGQWALYDEYIWNKYDIPGLIAKQFKKKIDHNVFIQEKTAANGVFADFENPSGVFSPDDNSVTTLQRRGVVFLACHNAIWEFSAALHKSGSNPDKLSHEQIAADLTNHLIEGTILTPGIGATILEMQRSGFHYIAS